MRKRLIVTQIIVMAIVIVFIGAAFSIVGNSSHNTKIDNATSYVQLTQRNITMTGNVTNNFRGDLVGTNNMPSPWGVNNVVKGLYLTYNSSDLFIGVDENISGNSLMVFLTNVSEAIYGTYNIAGMNTWNRNINFTGPMSYFAAVYFSGINTGPSTPDAFSISNYITSSSSPVATQIQSSFVFSSVNNTTEITIPWSSMFPNGYSGQLSFRISAFVTGGNGPWVGSGIPYLQNGNYNNGTQINFFINNTPDASQILPIAMGFMNPNSPLSQSVVSNVVSILENHKVGGLPRYYNDLYHYTAYGGYLQSSGPSPPWIITTLFLGDYDESVGNMSGALSILSWATNHTQSGLLPEAVDPNFGTVIASTSPLTWSSAMYVMVSLGYSNINILPPHPPSPPDD